MSEEPDRPLKPSPLAAVHRELRARLVPFAGWEMPVQYRSILDEHAAVRERAGIFDISHMGQLMATGAEACGWLDRMLTNRVAALDVGRGQYTLMLNQAGGVIDDLIIYRTGPEEFLLVVNAARLDEDYAWLEERRPPDVRLRDDSADWGRMAVQGPATAGLVEAVAPGCVLPPRNGVARVVTRRGEVVVCRTGYTGEDGFEWLCPVGDGADWFRAFVAAGAAPCGLGARDTLRLEMGYPLNGSDLRRDRTPLEAGLGFFVALDKGEFTGRSVLEAQKRDGVTMKLATIQCTERGAPPRAGYPVLDAAGRPLGELTSGALSPCLGIGIGMAYLPAAAAQPGTAVAIEARGRRTPALVVKKPFYKR